MDGSDVNARKTVRSAGSELATLKNRRPAPDGKSLGTGISLSMARAPKMQKSLHQNKKTVMQLTDCNVFLICKKNQERDAIGYPKKITGTRGAQCVRVVRDILVKIHAPAAGELHKAIARWIRRPKSVKAVCTLGIG